MLLLSLSTAILAANCPEACTAQDPPIKLRLSDDGQEVVAGDQPLATYVWRDPKIPRPYFAHLRTLSGVRVTRNHPPVEGVDRTDHADFHPGLWLAFGDLSGADFWRNKADVALKHNRANQVDDRGAGFSVANQYVAGDKVICDETCNIRFDLCRGGYVITWDSTFSGDAEFAFGDQEEMGLGIRLATPLAVKSGGRMIDNRGRVNEEQVWGQTADWCDASGTIDGQQVGITLMVDPANFRPSWIHARDYGLMVANPFGENAFTKGPKSRVVVRPGETLRLRYGVFVHNGPVDLPAAYAAWLATLPPRK
jgi:hypothetical protein